MSDPVLIVGAGISGLVLAQYMQSQGIPFQIFDRDSALDARTGGWGLTLHYCLPALRQLLPEHLLARFPETFVNKDAAARGDVGKFQFFNLKDGEFLYSVPAEERIRVNRGRLRELLTTGLDIQVCHAWYSCRSYRSQEDSGAKLFKTSNLQMMQSLHTSKMARHTRESF